MDRQQRNRWIFTGINIIAIVLILYVSSRLTKPGTWGWFENQGGITDEQATQVLGDLVVPDRERAEAEQPTTLRLNLLAAEAYRQNLLSEGQLARLLGLDRIELREILSALEAEGSGTDGVAKPLA